MVAPEQVPPVEGMDSNLGHKVHKFYFRMADLGKRLTLAECTICHALVRPLAAKSHIEWHLDTHNIDRPSLSNRPVAPEMAGHGMTFTVYYQNGHWFFEEIKR